MTTTKQTRNEAIKWLCIIAASYVMNWQYAETWFGPDGAFSTHTERAAAMIIWIGAFTIFALMRAAFASTKPK